MAFSRIMDPGKPWIQENMARRTIDPIYNIPWIQENHASSRIMGPGKPLIQENQTRYHESRRTIDPGEPDKIP